MGARTHKDGLSATGFPSGVAGMPAEVVESLSPLVFRRRELTCDSGGAGRFRGGLGQDRVITCSTDEAWSVSGLLDRTKHPAPGLAGGLAGAPGAYRLYGGDDLPIKRVVGLGPQDAVELRLPGGGGYGAPSAREGEAVLRDVVEGYVSIEQARERYGVAVRYVGRADALVRTHASYELDQAATAEARSDPRAGNLTSG
jgi:N-methylhydantoinase B